MRAALLAVASALLISTAPTMAATGDITWSRMSEYGGLDSWSGVSSYGMSVYVGGYHSRHAVLRRYSRAGALLWSRAVLSSSDAYAGIRGVAADGSGIYVVGYVDSHDTNDQQINIDGIPFISRYLPDGTLEWTQQIDVKGAVVATGVATFGNYIYVVGGLQENDGLAGPEGAFVRKYTRDGIDVWTRRIHPDWQPDGQVALLSSVAANSDGVYVAGQAWRPGHRDVIVRMYDQEGATLWTDQRAIGANTVALALAVAADETNAYVAAEARTYGAFLLRYGVDGFEWRRRVTEASSSVPNGVAITPNGIWVGGTTKSRLLNQAPGTVADPMGDLFTSRISTEGVPLGNRQYSDPGGQKAAAIDVDALGAYLVGQATAFGPRGATGEFDGLLLGIEVP